MKSLRCLIAVMLLVLSVSAQNGKTKTQGTATVSTSGTAVTINNDLGGVTTSIELVINGTAPNTVSVPIQGCMRSGTCDTLETYTTVANSIRTPNTSGKVYDKFIVTPSWTVGDATTSVTVNLTTTMARGTAVTGGGALTANTIPKATGANSLANSSITDNGTLVAFSESMTTPGTACNSGGDIEGSSANSALGYGLALYSSALRFCAASTQVGYFLSDGSLNLTNKLALYNNITTAGQGVTPLVAVTSQKVETGADASVLAFTPPAAVGSYEVCVAIDVSAANTATLGWTMSWTNSKGNANAPTNMALFQMGVAAPALTFTAAANNSYYACVPFDVNAAGAAVTIKTTFSGTSIAYNVSANIKRMN